MAKNSRAVARLRRHGRVRKNLMGTAERPRLNVFRSLSAIYAQIIDDQAGQTLLSASTVDRELREKMKGLKKSEQAKLVGQTLAERAKNKGVISMGVGKANAVPDAMRKASERARKNMHLVNLSGTTIPHEVLGKVGGARVMLKPASPGTGVIAAGGVRAVLEVAGVRDILTKSQGSANVLNVVQATFDALEQLKSPQAEATRRGKNVNDLLPFWERRKQNA